MILNGTQWFSAVHGTRTCQQASHQLRGKWRLRVHGGMFRVMGLNFSQWSFALLHLSQALTMVPPYVTCSELVSGASSEC